MIFIFSQFFSEMWFAFIVELCKSLWAKISLFWKHRLLSTDTLVPKYCNIVRATSAVIVSRFIGWNFSYCQILLIVGLLIFILRLFGLFWKAIYFCFSMSCNYNWFLLSHFIVPKMSNLVAARPMLQTMMFIFDVKSIRFNIFDFLKFWPIFSHHFNIVAIF